MSLESEGKMVIFVSMSFGGGAIYHWVLNRETRLTVVSDLSLVAGIVLRWCKTSDVFCDHLTTFEGG